MELRKTKIILIVLILSNLLLFSACSNTKEKTNFDQITETEEIVKIYYESLNKKEYSKMYNLISDGFKEIDPLAKDLNLFEKYMNDFFENSKGLRVESLKETSNDGRKATVDYKIIIVTKSGKEIPFESTFTMKITSNGWKLIHPYGDNIDISD